MSEYTTVTKAEDVTDEVFEIATYAVDGWYSDGSIDWEDVWNRMDGSLLADHTRLDMGTGNDSPAMRKIQRRIRAERAS